jgi:asparagine synthase (glutamine-hydrolysing)
MCGFVAIVAEGEGVAPGVLERMTATLAHRGPDDAGFAWMPPGATAPLCWTDAAPPGAGPRRGVLFGHRRLSILDLSDAAHQPFVSADGTCVLAYNGEIFNYVELRDELAAAGVRFRTDGDTEVVLAAWQRWGADAFPRLNGMWALVLWDARRRELIASRDRFGVKPLYAAQVGATWLFASEIKALLAFPGAHRGVVDEHVQEFLARALVDHVPGTMFRGVEAVPPASVRIQRDGRVHVHRFWTLPTAAHDVPSPREAAARYRALLADAVRLRTRADVPVGTMLSGGLDSTAITALIHEHRTRLGATGGAGSAGARGFHAAFTACWPDAADMDETAAVDGLCARFGLASHKLRLTGEAVRDLLPRVTWHLDEPFDTPIPLVQYLLMAEARRHGVKVVLNGHGSDEALAGYADQFVPPYLADLALRGRLLALGREWRAFRDVGGWTRRMVARELARHALPPAVRWRVVDGARTWADRHDPLFAGRVRPRRPRRDPAVAATLRRLPFVEADLWRKFSELVLPKWLRMEDRMSMAQSVESRLPFMDYRLVELVFALPASMKLRAGETKHVLRAAVGDLLPADIVRQRRKRRFATPFHAWLRGPWRTMTSDLLLAGQPRVAPYVDLRVLRPRVAAFLAGSWEAIDRMTLWRVLQTELWLRTFAQPTTAAPALDAAS